MKAIYLVLVLFVLHTSLILALPLEVQSSSDIINITTNVPKTIYVNITNPNEYPLYNIKATGDVVVSPDATLWSSLQPYENALISFNIKTISSGDYSKTIKLESFERGGCPVSESYEVDVLESNWVAKSMTICKDASIRFTNSYVIAAIDVNIPGLIIGGFNNKATVGIGDSIVVGPFSSDGAIYSYHIIPSPDISTKTITVSNTAYDIYDFNNDGSLNLNIHSTLEETEIVVTLLKTNFTMSYSGIKQGVIHLKNIGDKKAERIRLSGEWIYFDDNDFSINELDEVWITFNIVPSDFYQFITSDTNKGYIKKITVSGDNIAITTQDIEVFIEYSDVEDVDVSSYAWWVARKEYCDAYPDSSLCLSEPRIVEVYVANDSIPVEFNMTGKTLKEYLDEVRGLKASWIEYNNNWKLDIDSMKFDITGNTNRTETILGNQEENEKKASGFRGTFYLIFGTFMFIMLGGVAGYVLYRYYQRNVSRREGTI